MRQLKEQLYNKAPTSGDIITNHIYKELSPRGRGPKDRDVSLDMGEIQLETPRSQSIANKVSTATGSGGRVDYQSQSRARSESEARKQELARRYK